VCTAAKEFSFSVGISILTVADLLAYDKISLNQPCQ